jgi:long-chain fatty acid transport protein
MRMKKTTLICSLLAAGLVPQFAHATYGYFSHGYGMKSKGMAGAGIARTDDAFGGANNPAQGVFAGDRMDVGIDWFSPVRSAERSDASIPPLNGKVESGSKNFLIPEIGYNRMLNRDMSFGVTVYGNGGMNTDYPQGDFQCPTPTFSFVPANALCGQGKLGVDLMQLIVAPTLAYKIAPNHAIGVAPLFGYQRFKIEGVQAFAQFSSDPTKLTNNGYSTSTGYGVRVGYLGRLSDTVSIGAAYASKMKMGDFDKYKGLFAESGGFDLPEHYGVGFVIQATPEFSIAMDYERIKYNSIASVGNSSANQAPLGASNGPGFGWQDVDIFKFGVQYAVNNALTVRAGYGKTDNPILARDVTFNILAPGVVKDHYTAGFTYMLDKSSEITMAYMHAAKTSVSGPSLFNALFPVPNAGGTEKIQMYENSFGIAWGMRF